MNSHFENWSFMGLQNNWDKVWRSKHYPNWAFFELLESFWKVNIENWITFSIWISKTQVKWPKKWLETKHAMWFLTNKTQEVRIKWVLIWMCKMMLESSFQGLQLYLWKKLNQSLIYAVDMSSQSWRTHNLAKSEFFNYKTKNQQVFPPSYQLTTRGVSFSILLNVSCFFFHPYINAI